MQLAPNYYHSPSVARAKMPLAFDEVDSHALIYSQYVSAKRLNMHMQKCLIYSPMDAMKEECTIMDKINETSKFSLQPNWILNC